MRYNQVDEKQVGESRTRWNLASKKTYLPSSQDRECVFRLSHPSRYTCPANELRRMLILGLLGKKGRSYPFRGHNLRYRQNLTEQAEYQGEGLLTCIF